MQVFWKIFSDVFCNFLALQISEQIRHRMQTIFARIGEITSRTKGTGREDFTVGNAVRQRDGFVITGKNDVVIAADRTAADRVDADFFLGAFLADGMAIVDILFAVFEGSRGRIGQNQRRTAGSVQFLLWCFSTISIS